MSTILKKSIYVVLLAVILFLLTGCNKTLVGQWNYLDGETVKEDVYYTFNKDNTGSYSFYGSEKKFTYEDRGNKIIINFENTTSPSEFDYSMTGKTLTISDSFGNNIIYQRK